MSPLDSHCAACHESPDGGLSLCAACGRAFCDSEADSEHFVENIVRYGGKIFCCYCVPLDHPGRIYDRNDVLVWAHTMPDFVLHALRSSVDSSITYAGALTRAEKAENALWIRELPYEELLQLYRTNGDYQNYALGVCPCCLEDTLSEDEPRDALEAAVVDREGMCQACWRDWRRKRLKFRAHEAESQGDAETENAARKMLELDSVSYLDAGNYDDTESFQLLPSEREKIKRKRQTVEA